VIANAVFTRLFADGLVQRFGTEKLSKEGSRRFAYSRCRSWCEDFDGPRRAVWGACGTPAKSYGGDFRGLTACSPVTGLRAAGRRAVGVLF